MDEQTAFTGDENGTNKATQNNNDILNEDDDISDNDSVSSYDILPPEDFDNNEHGANSENVSGVYFDFIFESAMYGMADYLSMYTNLHEDVDVDNVQNSLQESFADNLSLEESDGVSGDHDEGEIDIEEARRQQQMLETHWKVMAMTFRSQGDAYIFYNNHAEENGFSIKKQKVKRGASGMIRYRRFLCSRAGRRQSNFITMEGRKRRLRPETRCDCGAHMVVKLDRECGVWFVASFVDDHNHAMARPDESWRDYQDYRDVVVFDSTYKINKYGMPFVPFVGVNNHRCTTVFGCAIIADETEGTYVWLLQTFMKANCQVKPKSIITDGDAAMIRAIRTVLPDVFHRLCSWHIQKNMQRHLHYKSLDEFRSLLYYATSQANFEQRWTTFYDKWKTDRTQEWLDRMYRKRRLWAASYFSDGFFLGMRSNQRSESFNSCLRLHLDYGMTIVDLVVHYENCIVRLRENEAYDDCEAHQKDPPSVTEYKALEEHDAKVFTPANFYILQKDFQNMGQLEIFETLVGIEHQTLMVTWKDNHKFMYNVVYEPGIGRREEAWFVGRMEVVTRVISE
ncbi:protein FAR1-RELATED SEQUENCE 5-like [Aegilops tauschii subsp. strangulata]|uniref:protein FAR1-RELATED SEQUENCE 5-like n=1 Tax=Aegilops tauschii subsp. strangulata TaxID=200361 RepID=UPI003CC85275